MKLVLSSLAFAGGMAFGLSNASADTYTVQQGDTLNKLAKANNVTVQKIADDNKIENINLIYVGEQIDINPVFTEAKQEVVIESPVSPVVATEPSKEQPVAQATVSSSAKDWIVAKESGGSYTAANPSGAYGKYQLMPFNLKYGTSPEAQDRAAEEYVSARYGSWDNAKQAWLSQGWY